MNKFYRATSNGLALGICATDKLHALEILRERIIGYGYQKLENPIIKREGTCKWDIGDSLIYGDAK